MTSTNRRLWLSVAQVAEHAGRHPVTVRTALSSGALHGYQRKAGASWRVHVDCVEAWLRGSTCPCVVETSTS